MRLLSLLVFGVLIAAAPIVYREVSRAEAPSNFVLQDVPKPLPEIVIADGEGKVGGLADYHGKFVLLNIWATWCVPCRKEMPTLDRLQGQLGGPDFEVVALSIDRGGAEAVRKFYLQVGIHNLALRTDAAGEAPFKLSTVGVPTTLLIDRQGLEIGRLIGPAEWDSPEMIGFLKTTIAQKSGILFLTPKQEKPS